MTDQASFSEERFFAHYQPPRTLDFSDVPEEQHNAGYELDDLLKDVKHNSRRQIEHFTGICVENPLFVQAIVKVVEHAIQLRPPKEKIPLLYLLDSIVKKAREPFISGFKRRLVETFVNAYKACDPELRKSMQKLLKHWPKVFGTAVVNYLNTFTADIDGNRSGPALLESNSDDPGPDESPARVPSGPFAETEDSSLHNVTKKKRMEVPLPDAEPFKKSVKKQKRYGQSFSSNALPPCAQGHQKASRDIEALNTRKRKAHSMGGNEEPSSSETGPSTDSAKRQKTNADSSNSDADVYALPSPRLPPPVLAIAEMENVSVPTAVRSLYYDRPYFCHEQGKRFKNKQELMENNGWRKQMQNNGKTCRGWFERMKPSLREMDS